VKYLSRFGWEPTVMTVEVGEGDTKDMTLLEKLPPGLNVARTPYLNVAGWETSAASSLKTSGISNRRVNGALRPHFYNHARFWGKIFRACLYFPDETVGWIPFGLAEAAELIFQYRYDLIYTTSKPRSTAVMGLLLKRAFGIPWLAEFRDPLYVPRDVQLLRRQAIPVARELLDRCLHELILRSADTLLAVTEGFADELKSSYGVPPQKVAVVPNGFDEADFEFDSSGERSFFPQDFVHLTHLGTIYHRSSGGFFPALLELVQEVPEVRQRVRVNIIGYPDDEVARYSQEEHLKGIVTVRGLIGHHDALRAMRSSDCLLLFYGDPYTSRVCVPGKIYEFLRVGRPVLAVSVEGGLKRIVEQAHAGWILHPNDVAGIKQALKEIALGSRDEFLQRTALPEFAAQYRYDYLAEKLAVIMDRTAGNA
jgi:glycosyltransferase involved in cell wall biosynthesis